MGGWLPHVTTLNCTVATEWIRRLFLLERAGLRAAHTIEDFVCGVVEGVTFGLSYALRALQRSGVHATEITLVGGGAGSDAWAQLCADVFALPVVRPPQTEAGASSQCHRRGSTRQRSARRRTARHRTRKRTGIRSRRHHPRSQPAGQEPKLDSAQTNPHPEEPITSSRNPRPDATILQPALTWCTRRVRPELPFSTMTLTRHSRPLLTYPALIAFGHPIAVPAHRFLDERQPGALADGTLRQWWRNRCDCLSALVQSSF